MNNLNNIYDKLGLSNKVLRLAQEAESALVDRFKEIDEVAEYNQARVTLAMQNNRVNATCFAATTGYGYNDFGRDTLEQV